MSPRHEPTLTGALVHSAPTSRGPKLLPPLAVKPAIPIVNPLLSGRRKSLRRDSASRKAPSRKCPRNADIKISYAPYETQQSASRLRGKLLDQLQQASAIDSHSNSSIPTMASSSESGSVGKRDLLPNEIGMESCSESECSIECRRHPTLNVRLPSMRSARLDGHKSLLLSDSMSVS